MVNESATPPSAPSPQPGPAPDPRLNPPVVYLPVAAPPTDGVAIASFVCGLLGLAIVPIILGHLALGRIRRDRTQGTAFAVIGLVLGYLTLSVYLIFVVILIVAAFGGVFAISLSHS